MSDKKSTVIKIVSVVLILLVVVGIIGIVAHFTNGFTGEFKSFYVVIGEEQIMSSKSGVEIKMGEPLKVDVEYTFSKLDSSISRYSVEVVPAQEFDFTVSGETYSFGAESDLTKCFEIVQEEKSFTLTLNKGVSEMLETLYPGKDVQVNLQDVNADEDLFTVIVYSQDGSMSVKIGCTCHDICVEGVVLDKEAIVF